jgi:ABC-2 type transport system ATP-binding protein
MAEILVAEQLSKRYGAFQALHDVSFRLNSGEIVGFLGPNGAGKSTTMKILTGFVAPSSGKVVINGHDLAHDPLACRRNVGYLPEELPLYLDMTVTNYLDHVARLKGIPANVRRREIVNAIEATWLNENAQRHIRKLSKGNRQRVGVAQALLGEPPVLILDEPTTGLDPTQVGHFRDLIKKLAARHTILLSTHILAEVEAVCSRVVVVHRGRTVAAESIDALRQRAQYLTRLRVRVFAPDANNLAQTLRTHAWAQNIEFIGDTLLLDAPSDKRTELITLAQTHGGLRELSEERRSLEMIFRDLISAEQIPPDNAIKASA